MNARPLTERITTADVQAVRAFLADRAERVARIATPEAHRLADGLQDAVASVAEPLLADLARHASTPAATTPLGAGLVDRWNRLMELVGPWQDQPGFDTQRWRPLAYIPADQESEHMLRLHLDWARAGLEGAQAAALRAHPDDTERQFAYRADRIEQALRQLLDQLEPYAAAPAAEPSRG
ncbi:hypothetical protein [Streptomyces sp. NRRL B-24484]|uniref:hypothetical protein n=1 Tax=Streptomyces sp. NRRL B-24484 TaxID=1463833 RepID=UPI0004C05938|nr:hypothetical protein [Streptomyces sp. NRRL B-24484]